MYYKNKYKIQRRIQILMPNRAFTIADILYSLIGGIAIFFIQKLYWDKEKTTA